MALAEGRELMARDDLEAARARLDAADGFEGADALALYVRSTNVGGPSTPDDARSLFTGGDMAGAAEAVARARRQRAEYPGSPTSTLLFIAPFGNDTMPPINWRRSEPDKPRSPLALWVDSKTPGRGQCRRSGTPTPSAKRSRKSGAIRQTIASVPRSGTRSG